MSELTASQPMPPTNARRSEEYWPYLIAACYVLVCTGFVLGNYQNPGGDFGQYITQARNLLWGRPWGHLMEGQPAVLPAYSALLALPTAIFGVNFHAYAALNTLLWAGTALIAYRLFAVKLPGKPLRVAFFVGVLCCPYVVFYQQQANPMLLYTFTIMLALLAVERLLEPSGNSHRWPWLLALLLPAAVRTDSIALFAAVFVFFAIHRQWRLLPWPVVGLALTVALDLSLGYGFGQEPNFATVLELWSGAGSGNDLVSERPGMLAATAFMALGYVEGLGTTALSHEFLAMGPAIPITLGPELQRVMTLPAALLFGLCLLGMVRGRWWDVPTLFFCRTFRHAVPVLPRRCRAGALRLSVGTAVCILFVAGVRLGASKPYLGFSCRIAEPLSHACAAVTGHGRGQYHNGRCRALQRLAGSTQSNRNGRTRRDRRLPGWKQGRNHYCVLQTKGADHVAGWAKLSPARPPSDQRRGS